MAAKKKPLTAKQKRFCQEYIVDSCATKAAIRAGYSAKTAGQQGYQLLENTSVLAEIGKLKDKQGKRTEITADKILGLLMKIADVDPADAYSEDGTLKHVKDMPEGLRKAISGIDFEEVEGRTGSRRTKKLRFWDKTKSLDLLGRHLKLFTDRVEVTAADELLELMAQGRARADKKDD